MLQHTALVSEVSSISGSELAAVGAALQKQVLRDVAPIWHIQATVDTFPRLEDVPLGYWPIILVENVEGAAGIHLDKDGQPYALVEVEDNWSLTASHECLEMLVDPWGSKVIAGPSVKAGQGRVEYLVEICDPSEDAEYAYTVNGVLVSDFYTPSFFDPKPSQGVRYSFTGAIQKPRQVLKGGYLSWHDPKSKHWWQQTWFDGAKASVRDLGLLALGEESIRSVIDRHTPEQRQISQFSAKSPVALMARSAKDTSDTSANAKADSWRAQIQTLVAQAKKQK